MDRELDHRVAEKLKIAKVKVQNGELRGDPPHLPDFSTNFNVAITLWQDGWILGRHFGGKKWGIHNTITGDDHEAPTPAEAIVKAFLGQEG